MSKPNGFFYVIDWPLQARKICPYLPFLYICASNIKSSNYVYASNHFRPLLYLEYMEELAKAQPDEEREADYCMRQLMYILRNPLYQRATATSMEALTAYLTPESRAFFEQRGGLSNAHAAERLPWPAASSTKK